MKLLAISALAALALAAPAAADILTHDGAVTTTVAVRAGDLDLNRAPHAATLVARLDRAAAQTCGASTFSVREYQAAVRRTGCYRDAMEQAVASLNAPAVTAVYRERVPLVATR